MAEVFFIKIDILDNWRYWHQFGDDFEAAGREVVAQANALLAGDENSNARAAELLREAKFYRQKKVAAGKLGGRPKKDSNGNPRPGESANLANAPKDHMTAVPGDQAEGAESLPANGLDITEVYEFAKERHLDDIDCREWWEMTVRDRGGCDRDGNPILNWKGAVKSYCAAKAKRRAGR